MIFLNPKILFYSSDSKNNLVWWWKCVFIMISIYLSRLKFLVWHFLCDDLISALWWSFCLQPWNYYKYFGCRCYCLFHYFQYVVIPINVDKICVWPFCKLFFILCYLQSMTDDLIFFLARFFLSILSSSLPFRWWQLSAPTNRLFYFLRHSCSTRPKDIFQL